MKKLLSLLVFLSASNSPAIAQSNLLESVKNNPAEAANICKKFRKYNAEGLSASSKKVLSEFAKQKGLSLLDAEILSIYVIGLHCPEVN
tara:strand:+ start:776 stop:1042 length:267 start_codon:yes stop_codon:yes gene_type:complete